MKIQEDSLLNISLSTRVQRIKPSPTLSVSARAAALRGEGRNIISLSVGEPDFDTPVHIKEAAIQAIKDGQTKYTPVDGTPTLKRAIIEKFLSDNQLHYDQKQILVSCGGKQSIYNLAMALLNSDDEVIIPAPYWVSYPDIVLLAEAKPVIVPGLNDNRFKITPEALNKAITPKTKLLFLNSPSNPAGTAYTKKELKQLAEVLLKHPHVFIATDDMYEHILWTSESFSNILMVCPDLYDRTIVLNGVSKAYAMTGWRIGYAAGPKKLIASMKKVQSQSTSNPCSIAQAAAEAALAGSKECIKEMVTAFQRRHNMLIKRLQSMPGVTVQESDGTFYSFPDFSEAIKQCKYSNDLELAEAMLEAGVAAVPGSAFGMEGHMRLSFALSDATLEDALNKIQSAISV